MDGSLSSRSSDATGSGSSFDKDGGDEGEELRWLLRALRTRRSWKKRNRRKTMQKRGKSFKGALPIRSSRKSTSAIR